jgi:hypothetical protein
MSFIQYCFICHPAPQITLRRRMLGLNPGLLRHGIASKMLLQLELLSSSTAMLYSKYMFILLKKIICWLQVQIQPRLQDRSRKVYNVSLYFPKTWQFAESCVLFYEFSICKCYPLNKIKKISFFCFFFIGSISSPLTAMKA